jgi:hypothetical protein
MSPITLNVVIPPKAGIQDDAHVRRQVDRMSPIFRKSLPWPCLHQHPNSRRHAMNSMLLMSSSWIPAFGGMTTFNVIDVPWTSFR